MGNIQSYSKPIKYLYKFEDFENISEGIKVKLSGDIVEILMGSLDGQNFTDYLLGLESQEIIPFNNIIDILITGRSKEGIEKSNVAIFENTIACLAEIGMWKIILDTYKTGENVVTNLKGKIFESSFKVFELNEDIKKEFQGFFDELNDEGFFVEFIKEKSVDFTQEFLRVYKFYKKLQEKLVLEEVVQAATNILTHLDVLYRNLFSSNYIGFMLPNGQILYSTAEKKNRYSKFIIEKETYLKGLSDTWYSITNINKLALKSETSKTEKKDYVFNENGEIFDYDMFPLMHRQNLKGSKNEYEAKKAKIKQDIVNFLTDIKSNNGDYSEAVNLLERAFLSAFILIESSEHTIQLRASLIENIGEFELQSKETLNANIKGAEELNILNTRVDQKVKSINNITVIYSMKKFEQEVLFAHKLYHGANATPPSISKPILGIKLDGTLFRENLFGEKFTTILAGSRSGKGTLTQSLLAPLIASGQSIVYLDNKPDIASLFWDLENKYKEHGKDVHFLAIDSLAQSSTFIKGEVSAAARGRVENETGNIINLSNIPEECPIPNDSLLLLRTFKTLQLLFAAGEVAADQHCSDLSKLMNYVFIDEITNLSERIYDLYGKISSIAAPKNNSSELEKANYEWAKAVCRVIKNVNDGFGSMKTMVNDKHNFKFILIGQVFNKSNVWKGDRKRVTSDSNLNIDRYVDHFVYRSMGMCNRWLSGRMQVTKNDYVLKSQSEYDMAGKTGVFLYHTGKPNGPENILGEQSPITNGTLFRSYFALVRNDVDKQYQDIKSAIEDGTEQDYFNANQDLGYTNKFLYNRLNGYGVEDLTHSLNELYDANENAPIRGVGFDGLLEDVADLQGIDLYSDEMVEKLNAPYDRLVWFLENAGIMEENGYTCLEDYLYDCKANSFFDVKELVNRFWRGHQNNGVYVPVAKVNSKTDYSDFVDDDLISDIDAKAQEEIEKVVQDSGEDKTLEEKEAEKQEILNRAEQEKEEIVKKKLLQDFMTGFNAKKGPVGDKISAANKKLFTFTASEDVFNSAKSSVIDYKNTYFSMFNSLLEPLRDFDDCVEECTNRIWDFINGKYAPIENLTYADILNRNRKGSSSSGGSKPVEHTQDSTPFTEQSSEREEPITPIEQRKPQSLNKPKMNGKTISSPIETGDLQYNIKNVDSMGNVKASKQITQQIIKDIKEQFGGINNIEEITITANSCLVINGYTYTPQFSEKFLSSLGQAIGNDLENGQLGRVVNLGEVVNAIIPNIFALSIESPKIAYSNLFQNELGVVKGYDGLFKSCPNLQSVYLPDEELTRNKPKSERRMGIGSKLSNLFGFGRGAKGTVGYVPNPAPTYNGNSVIDRMFDSKPVRVLTGAFGWTMGCKAVVLAATLFGPWGMLFGALAMAGAYKEVKNSNNSNNYSSNSRSSGSRGQRSASSGSRGGQQQRGSKPKVSKNDDIEDEE